jgi:transcriptional regulator with XRE-family HTH domain
VLYLAENIRRLRREHDLTQEELARKISVSPKTVSKWERGDGYPDIELLPPLAAFFECSVDDLLGMDKLRDEEVINSRIKALYDKDDPYDSIRNPDKYIPLYKDLHKSYPNNIRVMSALVELYRTKEMYEEAIPLLERLLELDPVDSGANYRARLTYCYAYTGRIKEAAEMSFKLTSIGHSTQMVWGRAMKGRGKDEYKAWQSAALLLEISFDEVFSGMVLCNYTTAEQKIALLEQHNRLLDVLYGTDCFFSYKFQDIALNCQKISELAVSIGHTRMAYENLEKMAEYAAIFDTDIEKFRDGVFTTPVFLNQAYHSGIENKLSRYLLKDDEENSFYRLSQTGKVEFHPLESGYWDSLRTEPRFQAVIEKLKSVIDS